MSERVLTPQQRAINNDPAWWDHFDKWWAQDFSWEGLGKHKIEKHPKGHTLQDYWREEEDKLIEFGGRKWTRFHLPPHDRAGNKSEKWEIETEDWEAEKWKDWRDVIRQKLHVASEYDWRNQDTRAQLQGVCFPGHFDLSFTPPEDESDEDREARTLHLNAEWARFGTWSSFNNATFGDGASFTNATFGNYAKFINATFGIAASFENATFDNRASFYKAIFNLGADFYKATFGDYAFFENAVIGNNARFLNATFGDYAFFNNATFGDGASFTNATFGDYAKFNNATFGDGAVFTNAVIGLFARFTNATFGDGAKFGKVTFTDVAYFHDSKFGAGLKFDSAQFDGPAKFHNAEFHSDTSFDEADFDLPRENNALNASVYQSAFRVLRQHMEKLGNYGQAHKFARLEMLAREMRIGSKDVPFWVRTLSRAYGLVADYGQSFIRPILGLAAVFVFAAISYRLISWSGGTWNDAISLAFQSSLPPISYSIARYFGEVANPVFLNALDAHWWTVMLSRLVMTLHGVASIALVFFLLLAHKRRFQLR